MKRAIVFCAVIGLACAAFAAPEIGKPAPDFTGTDINGKTVKLSDLKGKLVVLESYNMDCPFVVNHYKSGAMQELQKEVTAKGGVWLIVNSVNAKASSYRPPEKAKTEWEQNKMSATAWLDDNAGTIGKAYGMQTTPHMFVITKDGTLAYNGAIDDVRDASHDPKAAKNYVKEALGKINAGEPVATAETKPYGCGVKYAK